MNLTVKDTNISLVRPGDIILYKAHGLDKADILGELIATFEGGKGRYTHAAGIRDVPAPDTPVYEINDRPGIYRVESGEYIDQINYETPFDREVRTGELLRSKSGIKLEATWPKCHEWPIDWENEWMEVWRVRYLTSENISDILRAWQDMAGTSKFNSKRIHEDSWNYNIAEFLTFGLLNQAAAKICSQFVAEPIYNSTLFRGCEVGNFPIALTPDLRGIRDHEITPNDLTMSGLAYRITYQGLKK